MDWLDYRKKLEIDFFDKEKGNFCVALILNKLDDFLASRNHELDFISFFDWDAVSEDEYKLFCKTVGLTYGDRLSTYVDRIKNSLKEHNNNLKEFIIYYVALINCLSNRENGLKKETLLDILKIAFTESKLKYSVWIEDEKIFIFPMGAKELDDNLVSEPLSWLIDYPLARKAFIKALKAYSNATEESASDVADLFRKALESFFQEFFVSDKSLENLKSEYGSFLSDKGVPGEIRNNFEKLLELYTKYNNNYAKHHDKTSLNVLEYIMYQTGCLIRLLITLKEE